MTKKMLTISLATATLLTVANAATTATYQTYLSGKTFEITGVFGAYDFSDGYSQGAAAFDWAFASTSGAVYQLQGSAPTDSNPFGWGVTTVKSTNVTPAWYMFATPDDIDSDGSAKFDWILISPSMQAVYKLEGVSKSGTFNYSDAISIGYSLAEDGLSVAFSGEILPGMENSGDSSSEASSTSSESSSTSSDNVSSTTKNILFSKPSKSKCEANDGSWFSSDEECMGTFNEATEICSNPTQEQWLTLYASCSADSTSMNGSTEYEGYDVEGLYKCLHDKGFKDYSEYWSSTKSDIDSTKAWAFYFEESNHWKGYDEYITYNKYIRCYVECEENEKAFNGVCEPMSCQEDYYNCPTCELGEILKYNADGSGYCDVNDGSSTAFSKPTESECKANDGSWYSGDAECRATYNEAIEICGERGLPEKGEWLALYAECGADLSNNSPYNEYEGYDAEGLYKCLHDKGYIDYSEYWSSTKSETNSGEAWAFYFEESNHWKGYKEGITYYKYVRCAK